MTVIENIKILCLDFLRLYYVYDLVSIAYTNDSLVHEQCMEQCKEVNMTILNVLKQFNQWNGKVELPLL